MIALDLPDHDLDHCCLLFIRPGMGNRKTLLQVQKPSLRAQLRAVSGRRSVSCLVLSFGVAASVSSCWCCTLVLSLSVCVHVDSRGPGFTKHCAFFLPSASHLSSLCTACLCGFRRCYGVEVILVIAHVFCGTVFSGLRFFLNFLYRV